MPPTPPPPAVPCPYPPAFLNVQRRRLDSARRRLIVQLARRGTGPLAGLSGNGAGRSHGAQDDDGQRAAAGRPLRLSADELAANLSWTATEALGATEAALRRLDEGRYGWDPVAGGWLRPERLMALPTAAADLAP